MSSVAYQNTHEDKKPNLKLVGDERAPDPIDPAYAWRVTHRIMRQLNKTYFRSQFIGFEESVEKKSSSAPIIYASNHSGMAFPWDGMAMSAGLFERGGYKLKDAVRPIASPLLSKLPAMSPFLIDDFWSRQGAIGATMENFESNMDQDDVNLLIYPEGIGGIGKGFNKRYEVQRISTSMIRMSIMHQADIVLISTVGGEYINPLSYSVEAINKLSQKLGIPFIPVGPSLGFVLLQPWMVYFAFPAKLTFVRGKTFRPYEMVQGRSIENVTEREIKDIRDKIHEQMQSELEDAVAQYGSKPFDLGELFKTILKDIPTAAVYMPVFWPILFWETDLHNQSNQKKLLKGTDFRAEAQETIDQVALEECKSTPTLGSLWHTIKRKPQLLKLYIPGVGLWNLARGKI
jgi:1-acyl-sn-glycerol-3-phosphate acyltransferase